MYTVVFGVMMEQVRDTEKETPEQIVLALALEKLACIARSKEFQSLSTSKEVSMAEDISSSDKPSFSA